MTPKEKYVAACKAVGAIEAERAALVAPTEARFNAANEALLEAEEALEENGYFVGRCDTCGTFLFEGDRGFRYSDDDIFECAEHAPTVADSLEYWRNELKSDGLDEDFRRQAESAIAHLLQRDPSERLTHEL